jgi:transglutaminase-like putative cysteine protease
MFSNVYNVSRANIQIYWKDIPFDKFCFRDNRQKAVKKEEINGEYNAVITFKSPFPLTKKLKIPKNKENFTAFLQDTEFIKPSHAAIQETLEEIRADEKDPFLLVRKLLLWVYGYVKTEYIAETLSGPEVLSKRKGKCSEYTTLFASLSRAAGIPTRIAFGEATNGKSWVGHLWCEVWLGEWIAVDAAAGIFINSPSHIKLIDSSTLMGTQKIRWKLVDNLVIDVLDFKEY